MNRKSKALVVFLRVESDFPNSSHKNWEMIILFEIVQRTYKNASRVKATGQIPGAKVVSYAQWGNKVIIEWVVI